MLRAYVAEDCPMCVRTLELMARMHTQHPELPVEIVDVDAPGAVVPEQIFGTPIYTWNDEILFLGNPSEEQLVERIRGLHGHTN